MLCNGPPLSLSKLPLYIGDQDPRLIRASLGPSNDITIGSAVFAELTIVTDRPTDRPARYSVCNNRPHLRK